MASDRSLLDASAVLALLYDEPGAGVVASTLRSAAISSVNLAEVAGKLTQKGLKPHEVGTALELGLEVIPFTELDARRAGGLIIKTRAAGLSLGDRACLATALGHSFSRVLTADQSWLKLKLGLTIEAIRSPSRKAGASTQRRTKGTS